jgi:hypothetical protein
MNILIDLFYTNKKVFKKTFKSLIKYQELLVIGIPYLILGMIAMRFSYSLTFFAGLIIFAALSAIISDYLFVIENIVKYDRFNWNIFKHGFKVYFRKIFALLFVYYIVDYGIKLFILPLARFIPGGYLISFLLPIILLIVLNVMPETIYYKSYDEIDSIKYSLAFLKHNIISWLVPNGMMGVLLFGLYHLIFRLVSIATSSFSYAVGLTIDLLVVAIFLQAFVGFAFVYRGYLYKLLDSTTRKKRIFSRYINNE